MKNLDEKDYQHKILTIPNVLSILLCTGMMLLSFALYLIRNIRLIHAGEAPIETAEETMPCIN